MLDFAHPLSYLIFTAKYCKFLEYIEYMPRNISFCGTFVKNYFVTLQLLHQHRLSRLINISNFLKCMKAEDRRKLIERVQTLEGITDDERAALLGLLRESKTYGLVWEDKPEDVEDRLREELPVLIEDTDKAVIGGW